MSICRSAMDLGECGGQCMVCGDRSAGKHYGVMACYGCKGFFRRTIRSQQTYTCRFKQNCNIDKDQRNACRFCRFKRCIDVGMEPDAIRPDRDIIGKQKNPRRKKIKREDSSLPSPGSDSQVSHDDILVNFLMDVEVQSSAARNQNAQMGLPRIKEDPDFDVSQLFHSRFGQNDECFEMGYSYGKTASAEDFAAAMRRYVLSAVHWVDSLFQMVSLVDIHEKVGLLRHVYAQFTLFSMAARTAQLGGELSTISLCNRTVIPRDLPRHLQSSNILANNLVGRVLDEVVVPMRKLHLNEVEVILLATLVLLDPDAPTLSNSSSQTLAGLRDRVQNALFFLIKEQTPVMNTVTSRFGNLLLLLPPLAKLSSLFNENIHLYRVFGNANLDPILVDLFFSQPQEIIPSPTARLSSDAQTQTQQASNSPILPSDLVELQDTTQQHQQSQCIDRPDPVLPTPQVSSYQNNFYFPPQQQFTGYPAGQTYSAPAFFDSTQSQFRFM